MADAAARAGDVTEEIGAMAAALADAWRQQPAAVLLQLLVGLALLAACFLAVRAFIRGMKPERSFDWKGGHWELGLGLAAFILLPALLAVPIGALLPRKLLPAPAGDAMALLVTGMSGIIVCFVLLARILARSSEGPLLGGRRRGPILLRGALAYAFFLPLFMATSLATRLGLHAVGIHPPLQRALDAVMHGNPRFLGLAVPVICIVAPLVEETLFRGVIYKVFRDHIGRGAAIAASALLFAAIHMDIAAIPPIFVLGCLLAWSLERSGTLAVPVLIHALHNTATLAIALLEK